MIMRYVHDTTWYLSHSHDKHLYYVGEVILDLMPPVEKYIVGTDCDGQSVDRQLILFFRPGYETKDVGIGTPSCAVWLGLQDYAIGSTYCEYHTTSQYQSPITSYQILLDFFSFARYYFFLLGTFN